MSITKKKLLNNKALRYFFIYTILFAIISTGVFYVFIAEKRSFIWSQDAMGQYFPQVYYFMRETRIFIKELLHGHLNFKMYDLAIGFGDIVPMHLDPTYFVHLLFKPDNAETAYNFVTLLRYYLAGLTMSAYLLYFKRSTMAALTGSFIYIYSEYGLFNGMENPKFIMPMVFLPLCFLCVEEIMKGRRWYLLTILMAFQMWNGYYYIYMNTLAIGCYYLIRYPLGEHRKNVADFFKKIGCLIGPWFIGVLIGNMNLINSFASYLTSERTTSKSGILDVNYLSYGSKWLFYVFRNFLAVGVAPTDWTNLGFIPLVYLAVVVLFLRKGRKELKAAVLIETAFIMLPFVGYIFSGFGAITNRWMYMYAFTMAAIVAFVWDDLVHLSRKDLTILFVSTLPYIACAVYDVQRKSIRSTDTLLAAVLLIASFLFLLVLNLVLQNSRKQLASVLITAVAALSFCYSGYALYSPSRNDVVSVFEESGEALNHVREFTLSVIPKLEDDSAFYRAATKKTSMNVQSASMVLDYYGTVYYFSTVNKYIQDFYEKLGMTSWNLIQMKGFDGKAFPDTLASVKYFSTKKDKPWEVPYGYSDEYQECKRFGHTYQVYENEMALPIGYTYDQVIPEETLLSYDAEQRGEILMQTAVVNDDIASQQTLVSSESKFKTTGIRLPVTFENPVNMELNEGEMVALTDEGTSTVSLAFDAPAGCEIYLCFKNLQNPHGGHRFLDFTCEDYTNSYKLRWIGDTYLTGQEDFAINLGYHQNKVDSCQISLRNTGNYVYDDIYIFCQPMEGMKDYTDHLKEEVLEDVKIEANKVSGTISLDNEKLLVMTIPYQVGWTAYVDGKKADIVRANLMYSGLFLDAGDHTIEFRYCLPGFYISLMISGAALLFFFLLFVITKRRRKEAVRKA